MKKLFNTILNFGVREGLQAHDRRKIKTVNFLNLVVIFFLVIGYSNYFILGSDFAAAPVTTFLVFTLFSLYLSKRNKFAASFIVFSATVNFSIFYINQQYPIEVGTYLYYFPLIVTVVLLNNPSLRDKHFIFHSVICALGFILSIVVDIPAIEIKELDAQQIRSMWYYDVIMAAIITGILSFLLNRLILQQNNEIMSQNRILKNAQEAVQVSLKEKEVLLAELHHRVKNNLAIISGLLNLQDDATQNEEAKAIIADSKSRIMSMALVHRMLYENAELKNLDIGQYTSELVAELFNSYNLSREVLIKQEYHKIKLPVNKCIPLGLIVNELVTNSIKYVYKTLRRDKADFFISITENKGLVKMVVQDDGSGFPADFDPTAENLSLGVFLIKTLCEQIDGTVQFSNHSGARIEVEFPLQ